MAELAEAWEDYKQKILKGATRENLTKEEGKIHTFQDKYGYERTDFEARWKKNLKPATVEGPPPPDAKDDTIAQYEALFDEKELKQLDRLTKKAMAMKKVIAELVIKEDGSYAKNPAATGQIINLVAALKNIEDTS